MTNQVSNEYRIYNDNDSRLAETTSGNRHYIVPSVADPYDCPSAICWQLQQQVRIINKLAYAHKCMTPHQWRTTQLRMRHHWWARSEAGDVPAALATRSHWRSCRASRQWHDQLILAWRTTRIRDCKREQWSIIMKNISINIYRPLTYLFSISMETFTMVP